MYHYEKRHFRFPAWNLKNNMSKYLHFEKDGWAKYVQNFALKCCYTLQNLIFGFTACVWVPRPYLRTGRTLDQAWMPKWASALNFASLACKTLDNLGQNHVQRLYPILATCLDCLKSSGEWGTSPTVSRDAPARWPVHVFLPILYSFSKRFSAIFSRNIKNIGEYRPYSELGAVYLSYSRI